MATQFYFKREWIDKYVLHHLIFFNDTLAEYKFHPIILASKKLNDEIYVIPNQFTVIGTGGKLNIQELTTILNYLGFRIVKVKMFDEYKATLKIIPFPYTDPHCRAKELPTL